MELPFGKKDTPADIPTSARDAVPKDIHELFGPITRDHYIDVILANGAPSEASIETTPVTEPIVPTEIPITRLKRVEMNDTHSPFKCAPRGPKTPYANKEPTHRGVRHVGRVAMAVILRLTK